MSLFGAANNAFGIGGNQGGFGGAPVGQTMNTAGQQPQEKDIEVASPPTDSISALSFSPQAELLAVSSWDNAVSNFSSR